MRPLAIPAALSALSYTLAYVASTLHAADPLPLLIWHGLGDKFDNDGLQSTGELAKTVHPGTHVHIIRLDDDGGNDRKATFFGNVTEQVNQVCEDIKKEKGLVRIDPVTGERVVRADALGFSQGGQFLRGLIQRCDGLSVRSLVTFGSQHSGVAAIKACGTWDLLCKGAVGLMKGNAWTDYVQGSVVPAQYYRTVNESTGMASDEYLAHSNFLADINNERELKNEKYSRRLAELEKFVMLVFEDDTTVIPKESGWFAEVNATSGVVTPLQERSLYKEDWLGLKRLDQRDRLVFRTTPGDHMQLSDAVLKDVYAAYFGPERKDGELQGGTGARLTTCGFNEANRSWLSNLWKHGGIAWKQLSMQLQFGQNL